METIGDHFCVEVGFQQRVPSDPRFAVLQPPLGIVEVGDVGGQGVFHFRPGGVAVADGQDDPVGQTVPFKFAAAGVFWGIGHDFDHAAGQFVPSFESCQVRGFNVFFWLGALKDRGDKGSFQVNPLDNRISRRCLVHGLQGRGDILVRLGHRRRKVGRHPFISGHLLDHGVDLVGVPVHGVIAVPAVAVDVDKTGDHGLPG